MPYADLADVSALALGRTFTGSSRPNASQVADYLDKTAIEIDAILRGQGYGIPIATTATAALKLLEHGNALGAAAMVEAAAPNPHTSEGYARSLWEDFKKGLKTGGLELDADKDVAQSAPRHGGAASSVFSLCMEM